MEQEASHDVSARTPAGSLDEETINDDDCDAIIANVTALIGKSKLALESKENDLDAPGRDSASTLLKVHWSSLRANDLTSLNHELNRTSSPGFDSGSEDQSQVQNTLKTDPHVMSNELENTSCVIHASVGYIDQQMKTDTTPSFTEILRQHGTGAVNAQLLQDLTKVYQFLASKETACELVSTVNQHLISKNQDMQTQLLIEKAKNENLIQTLTQKELLLESVSAVDGISPAVYMTSGVSANDGNTYETTDNLDPEITKSHILVQQLLQMNEDQSVASVEYAKEAADLQEQLMSVKAVLEEKSNQLSRAKSLGDVDLEQYIQLENQRNAMHEILQRHTEQLLILREQVDDWETRYSECNARLIEAQIALQELRAQPLCPATPPERHKADDQNAQARSLRERLWGSAQKGATIKTADSAQTTTESKSLDLISRIH